MRFLVDEDLPRAIDNLLRRHGHEAVNVRDCGLRGEPDEKIASYALQHHLCLVTGDLGFADIRNYPPKKYAGIVVLRLPAKATSPGILSLLDNFLKQEAVVANVKGRLAIVEFGRVRIRTN